jgi:hypothetical protein
MEVTQEDGGRLNAFAKQPRMVVADRRCGLGGSAGGGGCGDQLISQIPPYPAGPMENRVELEKRLLAPSSPEPHPMQTSARGGGEAEGL